LAAVKALLRLFSLLFHALLTVFLIAISALALASGAPDLQLGMLPWSGATLVRVVLFGSLAGLITVLLAAFGRLRFLFFVWSIVVLVLLIKGYFLSSYRFAPGEAARALYLSLGALLAVIGAWFQMWRRSPKY
jgi:hypothetical protein